MATRKKKNFQLGSTMKEHAEREKRFRTRIGYAMDVLEADLDKGRCDKAFDSARHAFIWQGMIDSENRGRTSKKALMEKEPDTLEKLTEMLDPLMDRFKFQCVVGGAKFDGLTRRRRK